VDCDESFAILHGFHHAAELYDSDIYKLIPSIRLPPGSTPLTKDYSKQTAVSITRSGAHLPVSLRIQEDEVHKEDRKC